MTSNPLVSIIIPTYNRRELIKETLISIKRQTYQNWECIIVDDGSTDHTEEEILKLSREDSRFVYYKRPKERKKGANACRNYGFEKSKGDYIQWFDSDDLMHERMIEEKINKIHDNDYILCNMGLFTNNLKELKSKELKIDNTIIIDFFTGKIPFNTPMSFWKRETVKDFNFNEDLKRAQELDFFSDILLNKETKGVIINKILVYVREHVESITGNFNKGSVEEIIDDSLVRRKIWLNSKMLKDKEASRVMFGIYLKTIRKMLCHKYFKPCFNSLFFTFFRANWYYKKVILNIAFLSAIYFLSGKGWMAIKRISEKFI